MAALLCAAARASADAETRPIPEFQFNDPLPALAQAAEEASIPISGVDAPADRSGLAPGDTAAALISMRDPDELTQWILQFTVDDLTEKERATPPRILHLYSSTGHTIDLGANRVALSVDILGPCRDTDDPDRPKAVRKRNVRVIVNADLLAVGLNRAMALDQALAAEHHAEARPVQFSTKPFSAEEIAASRAKAAAAGITAADERALIGMVPAQRSFLRIIVHTPGLAEVLFRVVDVSWWAIISHGGMVQIDLKPGASLVREMDLEPWHLGLGGTVRAEPFFVSLDGHLALTYILAAVPPRPPLLTTAGVIGIAAQRPDGKGPVLMIQLISARCGPGTRNG